MFRTARAFLLAVPGAFLLVLSAYLVVHPRAAESFAAYPILADALGVALTKRPLVRFIAASTLFFLPPYLMAGLLLFFADVGVSAAAPLWVRGRVRRADPSLPPESRRARPLAVMASVASAATVSDVPSPIRNTEATPAHSTPCDKANTRTISAPEQGRMPMVKTTPSASRQSPLT